MFRVILRVQIYYTESEYRHLCQNYKRELTATLIYTVLGLPCCTYTINDVYVAPKTLQNYANQNKEMVGYKDHYNMMTTTVGCRFRLTNWQSTYRERGRSANNFPMCSLVDGKVQSWSWRQVRKERIKSYMPWHLIIFCATFTTFTTDLI